MWWKNSGCGTSSWTYAISGIKKVFNIKRYPDPEDFKTTLSLADGKTNGYTGDNYTGFYFTSKTKSFENIVEKFSRFFIDPILDKKFI